MPYMCLYLQNISNVINRNRIVSFFSFFFLFFEMLFYLAIVKYFTDDMLYVPCIDYLTTNYFSTMRVWRICSTGEIIATFHVRESRNSFRL